MMNLNRREAMLAGLGAAAVPLLPLSAPAETATALIPQLVESVKMRYHWSAIPVVAGTRVMIADGCGNSCKINTRIALIGCDADQYFLATDEDVVARPDGKNLMISRGPVDGGRSGNV